MSSIKPVSFAFRNKAGDKLDFKCKVSVSTEGTFTFTLPDFHGVSDFVQVVDELIKQDYKKDHALRLYANTRTDFGREYYQIKSETLKEAQALIYQAGNEYLKSSTNEELVILYRYVGDVSYCSDGINIFANGNDAQDNSPVKFDDFYKSDYEWSNEKNQSSSFRGIKFFSIGMAARVYNKKAFKRGPAVRYEYDNPIHSEHPEFPNGHHHAISWGERLNAFSHLEGLKPDDHGVNEMPYSIEAAKFFYDFMIGLCSLNNKLQFFFGQGVPLLEQIKKVQNFNLIGNSKEQ